ncbi:hypothetical protein GCM10010251_09870 [Streptomyces aurantiogriseus]|uniref:Uncharacterized protein n=1 Tax=Streptomyces aurantiogriseus TaxID=66870 RepID=A0A918BYN4_9ACTN|nr:hypothetical protein GCM10010251_09870 [Streptomyces aurantiogriseus]
MFGKGLRGTVRDCDQGDEARAKAIQQLESQAPAGHHLCLDPIYSTGQTTGTGTGEPEEGTPSPSPGPSPTPPGAH